MLSTTRAILLGLFRVYGLFIPLVFGLPGLAILLTHSPLVALLGFIVGVTLAWVWWSWHVPRWRLWALQRGVDVAKLHIWAVAMGLEWPYGHFFERTEIKTPQHHLQEITIQLRYYLQQARSMIADSELQLTSYLTQEAYVEEIDRFLGTIDAPTLPENAVLSGMHPLHMWTMAILQRSRRTLPEPLGTTLKAAFHFLGKYHRVRQQLKTLSSPPDNAPRGMDATTGA